MTTPLSHPYGDFEINNRPGYYWLYYGIHWYPRTPPQLGLKNGRSLEVVVILKLIDRYYCR